VIVIDTTSLVVVRDARDSKYRIAFMHLESLVSLTEACFHLPHRNQRQRLRRFRVLARYRTQLVA
jgi:hypothetical protein